MTPDFAEVYDDQVDALLDGDAAYDLPERYRRLEPLFDSLREYRVDPDPDYLTAPSETVTRHRPGRPASRLRSMAGAASVTTLVALGSGVSAAAAGVLPAPLQRDAAAAMAPLGVAVSRSPAHHATRPAGQPSSAPSGPASRVHPPAVRGPRRDHHHAPPTPGLGRDPAGSPPPGDPTPPGDRAAPGQGLVHAASVPGPAQTPERQAPSGTSGRGAGRHGEAEPSETSQAPGSTPTHSAYPSARGRSGSGARAARS